MPYNSPKESRLHQLGDEIPHAKCILLYYISIYLGKKEKWKASISNDYWSNRVLSEILLSQNEVCTDLCCELILPKCNKVLSSVAAITIYLIPWSIIVVVH